MRSNFSILSKQERKGQQKVGLYQVVLSVAMEQGRKMHKVLENELHDTIAFTQVATPEDAWALRFLNILFGLHELQLIGVTVTSHRTKLIAERISSVWIYRGSSRHRYDRSNRSGTGVVPERTTADGCVRHI